MKRQIYGPVTVLITVAVLAGCGGPRSAAGGFGGALAGGVLGGMLGGPRGLVAGAIVGGLFGAAVGDALDQRDRMLAQRNASWALEYAPSGTAEEWRNPDSGHGGSFTPLRTYRDEGTYCREYQQTVVIGGEERRAYGTACRQPDGSWRIVTD
jgi:surface antigen